MIARRRLFAVLGAIMLASACEQTTSVGAAGYHADAAMDADTPVDAGPGDGPADTDDATPTAEELCTASGGAVANASCCTGGPSSFPDTCSIGSCGCAPGSSRLITTCDCPGGCFSPGVGCVKQ